VIRYSLGSKKDEGSRKISLVRNVFLGGLNLFFKCKKSMYKSGAC
jgi:hypothetical protein